MAFIPVLAMVNGVKKNRRPVTKVMAKIDFVDFILSSF